MTRHSARPRLLTNPTHDVGALTGVLHPGGEPHLDATPARPATATTSAAEGPDTGAEAWQWR